MREVPASTANIIRERVESIWDITQHYWYPLYECNRKDVIAFNDDYIEKDIKKIKYIQKILLGFNEGTIYEMNEYRKVFIIDTEKFSPKIPDNLERFWFSEDMGWIIYVSHEGSITFGGEKLIELLESEWVDWQSNIFITDLEDNGE